DQRRGRAMGRFCTIVSEMRWPAAFAAGFALLTAAHGASAQEILLTGPLAGAPSVRKQKLYREHRFEIAPAMSFTLLDEYQRQIFLGARVNYNLTDWLAVSAWGAAGAIKINTALSENIQDVNKQRQAENRARAAATPPLGPSRNTLLT